MSIVQPTGKNHLSPNTIVQISKHERAARESLHYMIAFNDMVEKEILKLKDAQRHGLEYDEAMMEKCLRAKDSYQNAMEGLRDLDATSARHRLIEYGDAIQDIMAHINQRKH